VHRRRPASRRPIEEACIGGGGLHRRRPASRSRLRSLQLARWLAEEAGVAHASARAGVEEGEPEVDWSYLACCSGASASARPGEEAAEAGGEEVAAKDGGEEAEPGVEEGEPEVEEAAWFSQSMAAS
jgi:hypothetical protein